MTTPPPVAAERLREAVALLFEAEGMAREHARQVADVLVWADLRGVSGHGVRRIDRYLNFIARGELDPAALPRVSALGDSLFLCEAARSAGAAAMILAADEAATRAASHGAAVGLVRGTTHTGAIGYYVERLAARGFIGLAAAAGPLNMAYHGTATAALSTTPLAIAVPSEGGPLVLDMATSAVSIGGLRGMAERGERLPPGAALDAEGRPTEDPAQAVLPLPMAGAKGSGLAFMIECLASILPGAPIAAPALAGAARRHTQNGFILAVSVSHARPLEGFAADIGAYVEALKRLSAVSGAPVRAPGERGREVCRARSEAGIPLSAKTRRLLTEALRARGVDFDLEPQA